MQAPLSSTASGKLFRPEPFTASRSIASRPMLDPTGLPPLLPYNTSIAEGSGLAHDAGNLLGALGLYCELLALPGVLREEHRHYAEELQMLSGRSRQLIDRLLNPAITALHVEQQERASERVSLPDVIESCRGVLNAVARRAVTVAYEAGAALPVAISRESVERILVNLTKNAAEASPEQDAAITLRIACSRKEAEAEQIVLTVEDKGCGMSTAAVKGLLSERLVSPSNAGTRGIGFRVVRELVGASGGQLRLTSRIGSGTTVSIAWAVAGKAQDAMLNPLEERRRLMALARKGRTGGLSC